MRFFGRLRRGSAPPRAAKTSVARAKLQITNELAAHRFRFTITAGPPAYRGGNLAQSHADELLCSRFLVGCGLAFGLWCECVRAFPPCARVIGLEHKWNNVVRSANGRRATGDGRQAAQVVRTKRQPASEKSITAGGFSPPAPFADTASTARQSDSERERIVIAEREGERVRERVKEQHTRINTIRTWLCKSPPPASYTGWTDCESPNAFLRRWPDEPSTEQLIDQLLHAAGHRTADLVTFEQE